MNGGVTALLSVIGLAIVWILARQIDDRGGM